MKEQNKMTEKEYAKLKEWINSGKHLPPWLRDFHDQKDVFKTIGGLDAQPPFREYSWIDVHAISIDKFLWYMAHYGYTLQKTRTKNKFLDMNGAIEARREKEMEGLKQMFADNSKKAEAKKAEKDGSDQ